MKILNGIVNHFEEISERRVEFYKQVYTFILFGTITAEYLYILSFLGF